MKTTTLSDYKNRKYEVLPYDPVWVDRFNEEAKILRSIFTNKTIPIKHIGSTSVPGLAGKPTIDILILVDDISIADRLKKEMEDAGYQALGEYVIEGARFFVKESNNVREYNVHVFRKDHPHVNKMLRLRDYLRIHKNDVEEYTTLKFNLKEKYPNDYGEYRKHKDEWTEGLKKRIQNVCKDGSH